MPHIGKLEYPPLSWRKRILVGGILLAIFVGIVFPRACARMDMGSTGERAGEPILYCVANADRSGFLKEGELANRLPAYNREQDCFAGTMRRGNAGGVASLHFSFNSEWPPKNEFEHVRGEDRLSAEDSLGTRFVGTWATEGSGGRWNGRIEQMHCDFNALPERPVCVGAKKADPRSTEFRGRSSVVVVWRLSLF